VKVGDLVKVGPCFEGKLDCECFFCEHDSNRVGIVMEDDRMSAAEEGYRCGWWVLFDCGEWEIFPSDLENGDVEVIHEAG